MFWDLALGLSPDLWGNGILFKFQEGLTKSGMVLEGVMLEVGRGFVLGGGARGRRICPGGFLRGVLCWDECGFNLC